MKLKNELKEIEDRFDKEYTRKNYQNYRADWFIIQSKEIKQFYRQEITNLLEKQKADILEENKYMKKLSTSSGFTIKNHILEEQELTDLLEKQKADILEEIQNCWLRKNLTPQQTQEIIIKKIEKL